MNAPLPALQPILPAGRLDSAGDVITQRAALSQQESILPLLCHMLDYNLCNHQKSSRVTSTQDSHWQAFDSRLAMSYQVLQCCLR